ncbi:MAG: sigma-54 interaction domain-containing protein [Nitrospirales bacterium]|nr:sigma 54-interacting transcriptional regulator [Nitrospirales bacterium]
MFDSNSRAQGAETILDCISDGVMTIDLHKRITFANRALQRMLGYEEGVKEQLVACDVLVQSSICSSQDCVFERALQGDRVTQFEAMVRRRDGVLIPVNISTDFLLDQDGKMVGLVEVIRDMSWARQLCQKTAEVSELRHCLGEQTIGNHIVGRSPKLQEILGKLPTIAASKASILITGESGTGKELIAQALHAHSPRSQAPFVVVNCSSLSEGVLESELFGHVKGAFTNAFFDKPGRFEMADGGTIFLDEIGEMSPATQVKLLGVLERGRFERVGSNETQIVDVRIVAATNRNLEHDVQSGRFREDLLYRIRVIPIELPPLRERKEDIPLLANHFRLKFNEVMRKQIVGLSPVCLTALLDYAFPGNIRELQNVMEHAFVCCQKDMVELAHLPEDIQNVVQKKPRSGKAKSLGDLERQAIRVALRNSSGRLRQASQQLGISRTTLWRKVKELGLD